MRRSTWLAGVVALATLLPHGGTTSSAAAAVWQLNTPKPPNRALLLFAPPHKWVHLTEALCRDHLPGVGVNTLILQVDYAFQFPSHPELADGDLTVQDAGRLAATCRSAGIRVIPLFQLLGHQGWRHHPAALLRLHPDWAERRGPHRESMAWCPQQPGLLPVVFDLMDDLLAAFGADAIHVGMDEVLEFGECARCRTADRGDLLATLIRQVHAHIHEKRGATMLMWADRLLDAKRLRLNGYSASANGTWSAIESIPRSIVLCDWQYRAAKHFPSVAYLAGRGFVVWGSSWKSLVAMRGLFTAVGAAVQTDPSKAAQSGTLQTCWSCGNGGGLLLRAFAGKAPRNHLDRDAIAVLNAMRTWHRAAVQEPTPPAGPLFVGAASQEVAR